MPKCYCHINKDLKYQAFHVGVKCTVNTLSSNRVLLLSKLPPVHEAVPYLGYSEVTQKKYVLQQQILFVSVTEVGKKSVR